MQEEQKAFLRAVQRRLSQRAVGQSTVRGRPKKTAAIIRQSLEGIDLSVLAGLEKSDFDEWLDLRTREIVVQWGNSVSCSSFDANNDCATARKCLNIFLADVAHNCYLRDAFKIDRLEAEFELPIDSHVAKALLSAFRSGKGGRSGTEKAIKWPGLLRLSKSQHSAFQSMAKALASEKNLNRYELDVLIWRNILDKGWRNKRPLTPSWTDGLSKETKTATWW